MARTTRRTSTATVSTAPAPVPPAKGKSKPTSTTAAAPESTRRRQSAGSAMTAKGNGKGKAAAAPIAKGVSSGRVVKNKKAPAASTNTGTGNGTRARRSSAATAVKGTGKAAKAKTAPSRGKATSKTAKPRAEDADEDDSMDLDDDEQQQPPEDSEMPDAAAAHPHPILLPKKQRVPLHIVDEKWTHLPPTAQDSLASTLTRIESTVLNTFTSESRRTEAHSTLSSTKRKLIAQLPKIPVPSIPIKDLGCNLATLHETHRQLEAALRPTLTQIAGLDTAIGEMRRAIKARRGQLAELKMNAHNEGMLRRKRAGTIHPALRTPLGPLEGNFAGDRAGLEGGRGKGGKRGQGAEGRGGSTYDPRRDPEVVELKRRLGTHLGSIEANVKPLEGFGRRIRGVRGVVDEVLGRMGSEVLGGVMEV